MIVVPAAKNAISKNHPGDILWDENHLYRIMLVHPASNFVENIFKRLDTFLKSQKFMPHSLIHLLAEKSRKARDQTTIL